METNNLTTTTTNVTTATTQAQPQASNQPLAQPVVAPTEQPSFKSTPSDTLPDNDQIQNSTPPSQSQANSPQSDWRFNAVIGIAALAIIGFGAYLIYQNFFGMRTTSIDGAPVNYLEIPEDIENESVPENTNTPPLNQIAPPEGESPVDSAINEPTPPPPAMKRYDNYQYSFAFEYEDKAIYQTITCTANENQENKLVFYDSAGVTDNESLYAHCEPDFSAHFAKVVYTPSVTECLGVSQDRTVAGGLSAIQCSGQTTLASSSESTISLLIPKDLGTVVIEVKSPNFIDLIQDVSDTYTLETQEPEFVTGEE